MPSVRSLKKDNMLKHFPWLGWNWIKHIKNYQRSRKLFWTVYATAAKSRLVPCEPPLAADLCTAPARFAKPAEDRADRSGCCWGKEEGAQGTSEVAAQALGTGSTFLTAPRLSPLSKTNARVQAAPQLCGDNLQEKAWQASGGKLGTPSVCKGLSPRLLCFRLVLFPGGYGG